MKLFKQRYIIALFKQCMFICITTLSTTLCYATDLPLYKKTDNFKIFCFPAEQKAADELTDQLETFLQQMLDYLQHSLDHQSITLIIYPDLNTLHDAINATDKPSWVIGKVKDYTIYTVTPYNPGPIHSYNSVMRGKDVSLATLLIMSKYSHHEAIPRWLHQGLALYRAHYFSENTVNALKNSDKTLLTLKQLEMIPKEDNTAFAAINGFIISYSLVQFIDTQWGTGTLFELLENYDHFEEILKISKADFINNWYRFLHKKASYKKEAFQ
jgi:RNA polymerase sigma-70 factor, ECF subfamily